MHPRPLAVLSAVAAACLLLPAPALAAKPVRPGAASPSQPVYLALGDSVAAGYGVDAGEGYVSLLADDLRRSAICLPDTASSKARGCQQLQLVDLSVSGATTASLIQGQLPAAVELLRQRNGDENPRNDVQAITVTIGGNDAINPVIGACTPDPSVPACGATVVQVLSDYATNLHRILESLRAAAGPDTTIVTTAYDNPLAACFLASFSPLADTLLESDALPGLNDITRQVSAVHGAEVADAYGRLGLEDHIGGMDCLHPDASGHVVLADIFAEAILG